MTHIIIWAVFLLQKFEFLKNNVFDKNIEIVPTEIGHGAFDSVLVDFVPILFVQ